MSRHRRRRRRRRLGRIRVSPGRRRKEPVHHGLAERRRLRWFQDLRRGRLVSHLLAAAARRRRHAESLFLSASAARPAAHLPRADRQRISVGGEPVHRDERVALLRRLRRRRGDLVGFDVQRRGARLEPVVSADARCGKRVLPLRRPSAETCHCETKTNC